MLATRALALSWAVGFISASAVLPVYNHVLQPRDTVNGSCISGPDTFCVSLVGLCVTSIAIGQVGSTSFWSDNVCTAAATCAGMGTVLNAACCAGTCRQPLDITSLDYNNVYAPIVGDCAYQTGGCPLTWQPFVDWFYNTIQGTGTNLWPESGDYVLDWWAQIAMWTGFCTGDNCTDSAIPYTNLDDWFHYSSAVVVTSPGTPEYAPLPSTNLTKNWDIPMPFGRAQHQPVNAPPPVYVNDELVPLRLNGSALSWAPGATARIGEMSLQTKTLPPTPTPSTPSSTSVTRSVLAKRAKITPGLCNSGISPIETPPVLPTLTYHCAFLPNICANIRSHVDWDHTTDSMQLTYDPFGNDAKRRDVCTPSVKADFQAMGKCDPLDHNPIDWKVSCDEFPFNASLEGGFGNAIVNAVPAREQQYQGTLQSAITTLRRVRTDAGTSWKGNKMRMCHRYLLKLVDNTPANAPAGAIGSVDPGSAFFSGSTGLRWVTDKRVLLAAASSTFPRSFSSTSWPYGADDTALAIPGFGGATYNCAPTTISSCAPTTTPVPRALGFPTQSAESRALTAAAQPVHRAKRDAPACSLSSAAPLPTTSAEASAVAAASSASASAAAAAAAAALASASNPTADESAVAISAISAANALAPAAAALAAASSDASLSTAIAASQSAYDAAQDALMQIRGLGPDIPSWLQQIYDALTSSSNDVSKAIASENNVINPQTRIPPDTSPPNNPVVNSGPPPNVPPAACFPAGSKGFLRLGDSYFTNANGKAPAELVGVGSNAYFGLTLPNDIVLRAIDECQGVYNWDSGDLQPDFQVGCSTNELGSYWNGVKQACYTYFINDSEFAILCGNNVANIYTCLQSSALYGQLIPAFINWATS
ncbi:hypothetical protein C8Q73DRAFT_665065 [Cubamyces lactineus]|nr:hypothetical protein C8Q73DRAFT_665065 [Cubamyces lactineus]